VSNLIKAVRLDINSLMSEYVNAVLKEQNPGLLAVIGLSTMVILGSVAYGVKAA
jgi:hypothetical protein